MARRKPVAEHPSWGPIREKIRRGDGLWYGFGQTCIPGSFEVQATFKQLPFPIGVVWFRCITDHLLSIDYAWVHPSVRRCGVLRFVLDKLLLGYPQIEQLVTSDATELGEPAMRKIGWKRDKRGHWSYTQPRS